MNDAFERVTGYGLEEARRRQTAVLGDTALQPADLDRLLEEPARRSETIAHTIVLRRADGSPVRVPRDTCPRSAPTVTVR